MRCRSHRRYKAKLKPRIDCLNCWIMYLDKNPSLEVVQQEIHDRTYIPPGYSYVDNWDTDHMAIMNLLRAKQEEFQGVKT